VSIINMYRATLSLPPYTLDAQLSAFALAGSQELSMDYLPHHHFINAGNSIFTMGSTSMAGKNQGDPNGWRVVPASCATTNEEQQIA
jgi:hypothetical protein